MDANQKIEALLRQIENFSKRQAFFQDEIRLLRKEILSLKETYDKSEISTFTEDIQPPPTVIHEATSIVELEEQKQTVEKEVPETVIEPVFTPPQYNQPFKPSKPSDFEKFIGENLSNKIGIVITVLGISIGVKYAIDHNLISPLARILLGYVMGLGLFGVSVKLRAKYEDLSAVILSGALATFYFVTYSAYIFFDLIPQSVAFGMMVLVTVFTAAAALSYDRQVIAIGGLIGAYAIPFLLSNDEGRPAILFSYMTLLNAGILFIAFKKDWKLTNYLAFGLSWLIFLSWLIRYNPDKHFAMAVTFATLFFALFYATFLAYKLVRDQPFTLASVVVLLSNSFLFYGIVYNLLEYHPTGQHLLGLFTLLNAVIHFSVSVVIYRRNLADKNLFFLVSGLVLVFITMAIPVQLEGHWVTIFWAGEMALLFWIGRTKGVPVYEKLAYPIMILTFFSLVQDMSEGYGRYEFGMPETRLLPIANIYFLTTVLVIAAYWFVRKTNNDTQFLPSFGEKEGSFRQTFFILLTGGITVLVYVLFFNEINTYFNQNYMDSYRALKGDYNYVQDDNILSYKNIWIIYYSMIFAGVLNWINLKKYKNPNYAIVSSVIALFSLAIFLVIGLYGLGDIKNAYLYQTQAEYFPRTVGSLALRYVGYGLVAGILYVLNENRKQFFDYSEKTNTFYDLVFASTVLWLISSEMVHWLELYGYGSTYKLALSILFGVYALSLIVLGINKKKKHLRLAAMGLFGFTLLKLFLYDLANLETISKTIVMVSLGVLLLIISFLYNKYKQVLLADDEK